jgi:large subunit ribosomal protein L24
MKIKRNDIVKILAGKDKGKSGKVLKIFPIKNKAIVEGINYLKKHSRKTQDNPKGGVIQRESAINISNTAIICTRCGKPARVGFTELSDGAKARICKKCKETI